MKTMGDEKREAKARAKDNGLEDPALDDVEKLELEVPKWLLERFRGTFQVGTTVSEAVNWAIRAHTCQREIDGEKEQVIGAFVARKRKEFGL